MIFFKGIAVSSLPALSTHLLAGKRRKRLCHWPALGFILLKAGHVKGKSCLFTAGAQYFLIKNRPAVKGKVNHNPVPVMVER